MKRFVLSGLLLAGLSAPALAGSPEPAPAPMPPVPPAPTSVWDGAYAGVVLGYGKGSSYHCDGTDCSGGDLASNPNPRPFSDGALYGATLGYNMSRGNIVLGIEGDYMAGSLDGVTGSTSYYGCGVQGCETNIESLATLRGRIGLDRGNFMPYVTAGIAMMSVEATLGGYAPSSDTLTAPVAGLGAEFMFGSGWSAKAEYLHVFDSGTFLFVPTDCAPPGCSVTDVQLDMVRFGINKHW